MSAYNHSKSYATTGQLLLTNNREEARRGQESKSGNFDQEMYKVSAELDFVTLTGVPELRAH